MPKDTFHNLSDKKRQNILNIAIEEFAASPYHVASISKITRQAGIAKGSFYQYFENKKDLYHHLIEIATEEKLNSLKELPAPDSSSDLLGYIRRQFLASVYFEIQHPQLSRVLFRAYVEEIPFPKMTEELRRRGTTQFFKQLTTQGIIYGVIAPWVDPDLAAFLMETIFYQFGRYTIYRLDLKEKSQINPSILEEKDVQQLLTNLMDILEAGIKRNPQQHKNYAINN